MYLRGPGLVSCARVSPLAGAFAIAVISMTAFGVANAEEIGVGVRLGTLGIGADVDFAVTDRLSARVGFSGLDINRTINNTNVTYDGKLDLSNPDAILDWYAFGGGFRVSLGAVVSATKIEVTGRPGAVGTFTLNGNQYNSSQITSLNGELKFGNSVAPYVGIGFGNPVSLVHHFTFLFDIGAIYGGTPNVTLNGVCAVSAPSAVCAQLATDVAAERQTLQDKVTLFKWYPVISTGFAYRF
jgi:hypothetical protein